MRTLILASLALASLPSLDADACGPYGPTIYPLDTHGARTFALLGKVTSENATWRQLVPHSYDTTAIAQAPALDRPVTLTLVGPGGTRVVESRSHVFLDPAWRFEGVHSALEVDARRGEFHVALRGSNKDAKWIGLSAGFRTSMQAKVLREHHLSAKEYLVGFIGDLETLAVEVGHGQAPITLIRKDGALVSKVNGRPLGGISIAGMTYVVVEYAGRIQAVDVY